MMKKWLFGGLLVALFTIAFINIRNVPNVVAAVTKSTPVLPQAVAIKMATDFKEVAKLRRELRGRTAASETRS